MNNFPFTPKEFNDIYSKVPRLTVEIILHKDNKILLTKRSIEPCKGQWHLPGGTVFFGESLIDAVTRIAERELSITITDAVNIGYIEYPSHYKNGLDSPVGLVFEVKNYRGNLRVDHEEASSSGWFDKVPLTMHADQDEFLISRKFLKP